MDDLNDDAVSRTSSVCGSTIEAAHAYVLESGFADSLTSDGVNPSNVSSGDVFSRDVEAGTVASRNTDGADSEIVPPKLAATLATIQRHMKVCPACHSHLNHLLKADASIRAAFKVLDDTLPEVHDRSVDRILAQVRETPETAILLRRIRRPVNVMLMITVLAASTSALAVLAWLVYWWSSRLGS